MHSITKKITDNTYEPSKKEIFQVDEKTKLPSYIWLPDGKVEAIFIAIHGGLSHGRDWANSARYFTKKGIAIYALDLRWHGSFSEYNPGAKTLFRIDSYDACARDIDQYYHSVTQANPDIPIFILAHSNGALIAFYYGLTIGRESKIKGMIVSSPWFANRVKISPLVMFIARTLAYIKPDFALKPPSITDMLTHDIEITEKHYRDEKTGLRGTTAVAGLSVLMPKAQKFVLENIYRWDRCPVLAVIAGEDHVADSQTSLSALKQISAVPANILFYPQNYHENFNEINREIIFEEINKWLQSIL
jgi:lysophospholipase